MNRVLRYLSPIALCLLTAVTVLAANNSAVGTWKLDPTRSSFQGHPLPKFEQLVVTTDAPDALKWTMTGATVDGKTYTDSYDGPVDGKYHALKGMAPDSNISYTRAANGDVSWTVKDKTGAVVETATGHLSQDGNTLTLKGAAHDPSGKKANFVSVFTRTQ